jgi:hypothetical protein
MAKLTSKERNAIPGKDFALAGRKYPIEDPNHARNALARASQHASPSEQATIRRKVHEKYPSIGMSGVRHE